MKTINLHEERKGVTALIVLAFGFGLVAILVRYLSGSFTLFQQLYINIGTAFIFGLLLFYKKIDFKKVTKIPPRDWVVLSSRVVLGYLLGASLYRESLVITKVSNVTFLQSIPFGVLIGFILFREKLTIKKTLFIVAAFIGAIMISVKDYSNLTTFGSGEFLALISGLFFSLSYTLRKWQTKLLNNEETTLLLFFIGFIILFLASLLNKESFPEVSWDFILIFALIFIGFLNAINLYLTNYGYEKVPVILATNVLMLEAVFGTVLALLFFKEVPNLKELLGGILIIISVIQMNKIEEKVK